MVFMDPLSSANGLKVVFWLYLLLSKCEDLFHSKNLNIKRHLKIFRPISKAMSRRAFVMRVVYIIRKLCKRQLI